MRCDIATEQYRDALRILGSPNVNPLNGPTKYITIETPDNFWIVLGINQSDVNLLKKNNIRMRVHARN